MTLDFTFKINEIRTNLKILNGIIAFSNQIFIYIYHFRFNIKWLRMDISEKENTARNAVHIDPICIGKSRAALNSGFKFFWH